MCAPTRPEYFFCPQQLNRTDGAALLSLVLKLATLFCAAKLVCGRGWSSQRRARRGSVVPTWGFVASAPHKGGRRSHRRSSTYKRAAPRSTGGAKHICTHAHTHTHPHLGAVAVLLFNVLRGESSARRSITPKLWLISTLLLLLLHHLLFNLPASHFLHLRMKT